MKRDARALGIKAIEALPAGVHKIAPRLYLKREERPTGTKRSVLMRWSSGGRAQVKSLGPWTADRYGHFLAEAERADEALRHGRDARVVLEQGVAPGTFREAAELFMTNNLGALTNSKYARQWRTWMEALYPVLGDIKITKLEVGHIAKALAPDWLRVPVKAMRMRRRIELVLNFAIARGNLSCSNVAALALTKHLLPKQPRRQVQHMKALPYARVPEVFAALGAERLYSSESLRFVMLTASRSGEVREMKWREIDWKEAVWTCPAARMKLRKDHRVPLSTAALALLAEMKDKRRNEYVFPSPTKPNQPLSKNVMQLALLRLGVEDGVPHGLRSTFKDWCRETQRFDWEAVEMCLAHEVGSAVERSYGRSDLLHLRVPIMLAWSQFVTQRRATGRLSPGKMAA
jgi:integrase